MSTGSKARADGSAATGGTAHDPAADPNFTGDWIALSHDNLEALLRAQGVPERNIPLALRASAGIRQSIRHTRHHFRVTVNGHHTTYLITSGQGEEGEDEEADDTSDFTPDQLLTASTMEWVKCSVDEEGVAGKKLVVSSANADTASERRLIEGRMQVTNVVKGTRAVSTFERSEDIEQRTEEERKEKARAEEEEG